MPYDFDLPFQRRLLAAAWADEKWWRGHRDVVKPEFFSDELLGGVAETLGVLFDASKSVPDLPAVLEELRSAVAPGREYAEYEKQAKIIHKLRGTNTTFYQEKAVEFARRSAMAKAVEDAHQFVATGELDKIHAIVQRALKVGAPVSGVYDYFGKAKERARAYAHPAESDRGSRVSTGFGPIDAETRGGLGPGELGCFVALAGHGKSTALVAGPGRAGLLAGKSVLHVSLENSIEITAAKYDCALLGKTEKELAKLPVTLQKTLAELVTKLASKLQIMHFPEGILSISQLEAVIESAGAVDVVIVDYAAKMQPRKGLGEKRHELEDLFEELRKLAGVTGTRLWTAHQSNKLENGQRLIDLRNFRECGAIPGILDLGISCNRDEDRPAELTLYNLKNRMGKSLYEVPCEVDFAKCFIKPLSDG